MRLRRFFQRQCLKRIRLIVIMWIGTVVVSLYLLERIELSGARQQKHSQQKQTSDFCDNVTFNGTFKENLQKLRNLVFNDSLPWIQRLDAMATKSHSPASFPVFVTASDQTYFIRSQGLVKSVIDRLMPVYKGLKLIYFDLGLSASQRQIMENNCKCEIRQLPFDILPKHVQDPATYAFKPVIIYLMYLEFGHVWWLDASARFVNRDLRLPLKYLKETGTLFFTFDRIANIAVHTDRRTFHFFKEDPCLYENWGEIDASNIAFRKSRANDVVLRQWLSCALDRTCIAPDNVTKYCQVPNPVLIKTPLIGQCHRFDQSALGIILRRLYHKQNHYPLVEMPFKIVQIRRKEDIQYFYDPRDFEREMSKNKFAH